MRHSDETTTTMKTQTITSFYKTVKSIKNIITVKSKVVNEKSKNSNKSKLNSSINKRTPKRKASKSLKVQLTVLQKQINDLKAIKQQSNKDQQHQGPDFKIYECDDFLFNPVTKPECSQPASLAFNDASYVNICSSPCPPPLPPRNQKPQPPKIIRRYITYC